MVRFRTSVVVLASLALFGAAAPAQAAGAGRLVAFRSCPDLVNYAKTNASRFVGPYGLGSPIALRSSAPGAVNAAAPTAKADNAAPQEGVDYSGTNVQETGVDEPDLVKTDGNTLFMIDGNQLESDDVRGAAPKLLDTLKLANGWASSDLLLSLA